MARLTRSTQTEVHPGGLIIECEQESIHQGIENTVDNGTLRVVATLQRVTKRTGAVKSREGAQAEGEEGAREKRREPTTEIVFSEPKTAKSRRQISLAPMAIAALRRHRARQAEERLKAGPAWQDNDLVFPNQFGRPTEAPNLMKRSFKPILRRAGLLDMPFHALRHSAATLYLRQNVHPKVVSEMLGHSKVGVTLDLYSHCIPDMQREATGLMEGLLGG